VTSRYDEVAGWLRTVLPPAWMDAADSGDEDGLRAAQRAFDDRPYLRARGESGYAVPGWPRAYLGLGLPPDEAQEVQSILRHYRAPTSPDFAGINMIGPTILEWGTQQQKDRFLPPIAMADEAWCQLYSEPGAGSDLASLATRAHADGSSWRITGQKVWTSQTEIADLAVLLARTDPEQPKTRGITCFIMDMAAAGVDVRPLRQINGDSEFSEVFLDDVVVSDAMRLGPPHQGWQVASTTLAHERASISVSRGVEKGRPGDLVDLAKRTGRWADTYVRNRILQLIVEDRILQLTIDRYASTGVIADGGAEMSITKVLKSELNQRTQCMAVDLLGPRGGAWEPTDADARSIVSTFLESRADTIAGGTSEIQRNIIGERVLGLPREPSADHGKPWSAVARSRG
jgi:3-oxochol-4-en-24-oyl-CoA dehydrogenase